MHGGHQHDIPTSDLLTVFILPTMCRDLAHWLRNGTFFSRDVNGRADPHLGVERLHNYIDDLTNYVNMLRAGFPDAPFLALHTMPQRNPRLGP